MARKSKTGRKRDTQREELERLRAIDASAYAEIVIVSNDESEDDGDAVALIVNGVPHLDVLGSDVADVLRKFADLIEASREGVRS